MPKLIPVTIPKWGIEMERGTISEWRVAVGDTVAKGDELVDIETDKIVNSFEATDDGLLVRVIAEEGDELDVGTLIGVMASEAASDEEIDAFIASFGDSAESAPAPAEAESIQNKEAAGDSSVAAQRPAGVTGGPVKVSPALQRKAQRLGIDLREVSASGEGGRILRDDIEAARAACGGVSLRAFRGAQKTVAERMTLAKQTIPHFYLQRDCAMDAALASLEQLREESDGPITINHVLVQAVARALVDHPELNVNVLPGGIKDLDSIDVSIAVDTGDSLLTPVIRDLGEADIATVAKRAGQVVERVRNRQIVAGELDGGAVTVSNLGMFGVDSFTAIINPPQVMILAVGAIKERLVLQHDKPTTVPYCSLTLACDHRVINGAAGARFLASVCEIVEAAAG